MMVGRGSGQPTAAGGPALHIPVLVRQALDLLRPRDGGVYVDGTFGAGGHTRHILAAAATRVIGLDRDPTALAVGWPLVEESAGRLTLVQANFSDLQRAARDLGIRHVDGVLLDLGVSSMQLDTPERGFSLRSEGPLDMRMSQSGPSAADVVAHASERDLATIIAALGEERHARAVARAIVAARRQAPIRTTMALAAIVSRAARSPTRDIDPATRTFQALRIFVNDELRHLERGLFAAEHLLRPRGRLVVIAFHSLEDRIVKTFLSDRSRSKAPSRHLPERVPIVPSLIALTKRPITPDAAEIAANPRARSARLRAAERTDAKPAPPSGEARLPKLPALEDVVVRR
jgi:16S rRNA (cytosine1402-N4)-methyltransferase